MPERHAGDHDMTTTHDAQRLKGNFVLLKAGRLQLLLPQHDVGAVEHLATTPQPTGQAGMFELPADDTADSRFVAALSPQMGLLEQLPPGRFLLTSFPSQPGVLMGWDDVKVLIDAEIVLQALPLAMLGSGAPLTEYVEFGDEVAFCCSAEGLLAQAFPARS
jgi:hypothetical protein